MFWWWSWGRRVWRGSARYTLCSARDEDKCGWEVGREGGRCGEEVECVPDSASGKEWNDGVHRHREREEQKGHATVQHRIEVKLGVTYNRPERTSYDVPPSISY